MKTCVLSILIVLGSVTNVSCGNSYYVYNLAVDMIRETDVVFKGGFRTQMTLEEYVANDSLSLQVAEIHSRRPRFSWQIFSTKNNTYQQKYRILVASSKELIDNDNGDVWDSGLVVDSSSVAVVYGGGALSPATLYYWKVMIVDDRGRKSDFSDAKGFVTAHELDDYTSVLPLEKHTKQPLSITLQGTTAMIDFGKDAFSQMLLWWCILAKIWTALDWLTKSRSAMLDTANSRSHSTRAIPNTNLLWSQSRPIPTQTSTTGLSQC